MTTETVTALFDRWNDALQTRDPDAVVALYADDAILLPTVSNQVRHTPAERRDYFVSFLKKSPKGTLTESNVRELSDDLAINSGTYVFDLSGDDGTTRVPARFTFLYRRDGDDWKIIEHHSSAMPE